MIAIILQCKASSQARARYVFEVFFDIIGITPKFIASGEELDGVRILIRYGNPGTAQRSLGHVERGIFTIDITEFNYDAFLQTGQEPEVHFADGQKNSPLPYLFFTEGLSRQAVSGPDTDSEQILIEDSATGLFCNIDLVATAYHMLSLQNEIVIAEQDELGRFQRHFANVSNAIYDYPVVDIYANLILDWLRQASQKMGVPLSRRAPWPDGASFALCLTHDVDRLNTWTFSKALRILGRIARSETGRLKAGGRFARSLFHAQNWCGNFDLIGQLEDEFDARSSYYFVPKSSHKLDPKYRFGSRRMKRILRTQERRGSEIGVHGSIRSATRPGRLAEECGLLASTIDGNIVGGRQHFLCFRNPVSFGNFVTANLKYDSTLGFGDEPGFRTGTSVPFRPINDETGEVYDFYELPLVLMDAAVIKDERYLVLDEQSYPELWNRIEQYLTRVRDNHGCMTILWHNTDFDPADVTGFTRLYRQVLEWVRSSNGWICAASDIVEWRATR